MHCRFRQPIKKKYSGWQRTEVIQTSPAGAFLACDAQARSKRSRFMTLFHAAMKSCTNFSWESSLA